MMSWQIIHRADPRAAALADRHYGRRTVIGAQPDLFSCAQEVPG